jgi:hypothetical protein
MGMTNSFKIGLSSWIIQDGNYPDFKQGERAAFAIEFFAPTASWSILSDPRVREGRYTVSCER